MSGWTAFLQAVQKTVWGPPMLFLVILSGLIYSVRSGFFQIFGFPVWMRETVCSLFERKRSRSGFSPVQALTTALAGSIGIGNIAGVATALVAGGPGAVFWMWVSALLGMMLKYGENVLGVRYRVRTKDGWRGGPMYYLRDGAGLPWLAAAFSLFCVLSSLGSGNMAQVGSVSEVLYSSFSVPRLGCGLVLAALCLPVLLGGAGRLGRVTEKLVPLMALFYTLGCAAVLIAAHKALPAVFARIFHEAFSLRAAGAGAGAWGILAAMRYGVARGVFSNEAGMGSSAMVYAAADGAQPERQGMWGMFEVFIDTVIGCTLTALCILSTGVLDSGADGATLAARAFSSVLGSWGGGFVAVSTLLFGFASLLGWSYYGEQSVRYLTERTWALRVYQAGFLLCVILGAVMDLTAVWDLADITNGLMALPNLLALLLLRKEVFPVKSTKKA